MQSFPLRAALCLCLSLSATFAAAADARYNANLLLNAGADASTGSPDGVSAATLPRWLVNGELRPVVYGAPSFPDASSAGPTNRRLNFFAGGPANALSSATQRISLVALGPDIDTGKTRFRLSGFLGGFASQDDHAVLSVRFLDAADGVLSAYTLPSVSASERAGVTGLLKRQKAGPVPRQARTAEVTLEMVRTEGSYNDGYADSMVFMLVPKP